MSCLDLRLIALPDCRDCRPTTDGGIHCSEDDNSRNKGLPEADTGRPYISFPLINHDYGISTFVIWSLYQRATHALAAWDRGLELVATKLGNVSRAAMLDAQSPSDKTS